MAGSRRPSPIVPSNPANEPETRRTRELITPEGVDLRLELAEASARAGAFMIDTVIIIIGLILFLLAVIAVAFSAGQDGRAYAQIILLLVFFFARNFYFIAWELTPGAATPGKRLMGLRVAARNGGRLDSDAIFARNAMRELEFFLPLTLILAPGTEWTSASLKLLGLLWSGVFLFFPLFNRDRLRVGDLLAGTWVVRAPRRRLDVDLADAGAAELARYEFSTAQLNAYGVKELHVLEDVLRRKDRRTMAAVAQRIRAKIEWQPQPDETDLAFLNAYYAGLRGRLETRLLFGHRRKDKFDT
jgi:uncharacterized RDD family membrane protein YckC